MDIKHLDPRLFVLLANKLNQARLNGLITAKEYSVLMLDYDIALYYNDEKALYAISQKITQLGVK